jgi:NhaC family Na+:H+ antiporter
VLGFTEAPVATEGSIQSMLSAINLEFFINPVLLLVPVLLIVLIIKKVPPIPALFGGVLLGAIFALIFQRELLVNIQPVGEGFYEACFTSIMDRMYGSVEIKTTNEQVDNLLSTGGMAGMLDTIWLILTAMVFSGIMESAGLLIRIAESIVRLSKSTCSLVASTVATSIFMNVTASEQYISIVIPGRMFKDVYEEKGLKPELLSRTLEDGGTVTSVLIPWNTCGAVQASVLGVSTLVYAPFVFFSILSPIVTIAFAYFNIKIRRFNDEKR